MTDLQNRTHDYFRNEGFLPVDKESHSVYREFYDKGDSLLQEMTAMISATASAFSFTADYKIIHEYLCTVWFYPAGEIYFNVQWPTGDSEYKLSQIIDILYDLACGAGLSSLPVSAIEERFLSAYKDIDGYDIQTEYNDDYSEYAYKTKDLLELSGGVNFYKRKRLKKCLDTPDTSLQPISKENFYICFDIENVWCSKQDCSYCSSFIGCEKLAMKTVADIFDEKIHTGLFLYHNGKPEGYIICEKKNQKAAFLYYGKANMPDFFVYLIYMVVKMHFQDVEYFNVGPDIGKDGLRMFKQHLSVHELWRKYLCTYKREIHHD